MEFLSRCNVEQLYADTHIIAYVYHWDRDSIWNMSRNERQKWVEMIINQQNAERDSLENK